MNEIALLFPNQLFLDNFPFTKQVKIYFIEHPRYFTDFAFHKQKIILHRASMRSFYDHLKKEKYIIEYIAYKDWEKIQRSLSQKITCHIIDPVDHKLKRELLTLAQKKNLNLIWHESPLFLTDSTWIDKNYGAKKTFLMHSFYIQQRKRLNILLVDGKPEGGRWSFDTENRSKIPHDLKLPKISQIKHNNYVVEALNYVEANFKENPGKTESFNYPINHDQANRWFLLFLKERLGNFGIYEDAILKNEGILFHSVLSTLLNTGLLAPDYVVSEAVAYGKKHGISINNIEGFVRQIIGWREFVRLVYQIIGEKQRKSNFFNARKQIPHALYTGKTGINPVDDCIHKVLNFAYTHHIERLMVLGNYMLLLEIKPADVYQWFMEMYIDAYDWVMVPNVYGMSQYAHPSMTTKPYIASSNYILKMSDYKKDDWCLFWDSLFWQFLYKHRKELALIPRMQFIMKALSNKTESQMKRYLEVYQKYTQSL